MKCEAVRERMMDALQGPPAAELQAHLDRCPECAAKLAGLRQTMAMLDEWKAPEVSAYFDPRLQARLREEQQRAPRGWFAWVSFKPAAAALVLLLALGVGLLNTGTPPERDGDTTPYTAATDSAVGDLETLDENDELLANFELLDEIGEAHENGS